ncbi:MAG: cytochrome P450 [Reyranella sp.]|uniref:cytochrome P450 n=1 Tax=Reyranella sp. TaxID=1929291 RepID=UPI001AD45B09|nr:cytochrome P450 [Reyranella sp.]MBN9089956.1 cytochrome P450 [Reyranella sp.]
MFELKYFDTIRRYEKDEASGKLEYPPFDIKDLGVDNNFRRAGRWLQRYGFIFVGWFVRTLWPFPFFRIGRAIIVGGYDDVVAVLKNRDDFRVPFGPEMMAITRYTNFVLGLDGQEHDDQRALMEAAVPDRAADLKRILDTTRDYTEKLLASSGGQIDVMRDLLGRVFTESADEYFGLNLDEPNAFLDRSFAISNVIFADPFGNKTSRKAAISGALRFRYMIDRAIDNAKTDPRDTFIRRLVVLKCAENGGTLSDEAKDLIRSIAIGTLTGLIPTNSLSAGKILEELLRHPKFFEEAKQVARDFKDKTKSAGESQRARARLRAILFEAARLNPALFPGQWRYAPKEARIGGKTVPGGSVLMVATMSALRDRRIFAEPGRFWPDRGNADKTWLMFGADSHVCFGIWVAIEQFTEIFGLLLSQPDIRTSDKEVGWSTYIGPFPRRLDMLFTTDLAPRKQELITIQARLRSDVELSDLQRQLEALGNPASHDSGLGKALRDTELVHFASLSAFDAKDPDDDEAKPDPRLVFEINADGDGERALAAIADKAGTELQPIFAQTLGGDRPLLDVLRRQRVILTYSPWQAIGLNFNGLPDCSVCDVAMQEKVADEARSAVVDHVKTHGAPGNRPIAVLRAVRQTLRKKGYADDLIRPSRRRLGITEWSNTDKNVGLSALLASRPALYVKLFLALLLLGQGALIYHFIVEDSHAHWIAGASFFAILAMLTGLSVNDRYRQWLIWYWARVRYLFAHAVVGLTVVATVAAVAALTVVNITVVGFGLSVIGLPSLPSDTLAVMIGLALLRVEYVWGVWLLDRGRKSFSVLRDITLVAIVLVLAVGGWLAATHWTEAQSNAASLWSQLDLTALGSNLLHLIRLDNAFLRDVVETLSWIFYAAAGAIVSTALGAALIIGTFLAILRWHEIKDTVDERPAKIGKIREIAARENAPGYAMNHITAVTPMKTGWFRKLTLAVALAGIGKLVQYWYRPGFVLNMGTIHYARWFRLPGSEMLVFFSNYDGSWESYLEDFITKAHAGQTAAWSNGRGFPPTRYLIYDGAQDGARFKRWVRLQQQPTSFWFARFPHLTTDQIRNNAVIHDGLMRAETDSAAEAWLSCFGSMPRPDATIEMQEVQSIVFRGFPSHPFGAMAAITLPSGPEVRKAQAWLQMVERNVWFGEIRSSAEGPPSFVSFSATGLAKLLDESGVDSDDYEDLLASFPPAFRIGMGNRAKILRDEGDSAPEYWAWSDTDNAERQKPAVDALVLVYGKSPDECVTEIDTHRQTLTAIFGEPGTTWSWEMLETRHNEKTMRKENLDEHDRPRAIYEHFGFRDGISQPIIRGTQKSMRNVATADLVEAGEVVLGYKNNAGLIDPPITLPAEIDTRDILPMDVPNLGSRFPRFGAAHTAGLRDFGRNGTFIAVRQYEQHVDRFETFVKGWTRELTRDRHEQGKPEGRFETLVGCPIDEEWVASKLMGRRYDGRPLLGRVTRRNDNDFNFGVDDPQGLHCPCGAHMRRANPRGGMNPDDPMEIDITKRHRILRRGRPYQRQDPADPSRQEKGLLFIGLCADIERQFEFLQQSWISSPAFQGLSNEPDPITATGPGVFTIPTTAGPIRLKRNESFVTVRAGGYFFMPSRAALILLASRSNAPLRRKRVP